MRAALEPLFVDTLLRIKRMARQLEFTLKLSRRRKSHNKITFFFHIAYKKPHYQQRPRRGAYEGPTTVLGHQYTLC